MENKLSPNIPQSKSARKKQRDRELKEMDIEEWERRRDLRNEKRRERRRKLKEENPDEYQEKVSQESTKRQERRIHVIEESPEEHAAFLQKQKEFRQNIKIKMFNDLFDSLFEKNKHTFPTPISPKLWEKLKAEEIEYLNKHINNPSISLLEKVRRENLEFLRNNPNFPHGGSLIFFIKTLVHYPRDQRIINAEERDYINSLVLSPLVDEEREFKKYEYYEKKKEYYKEKSKTSYEKKKSSRILDNLNVRFIAADPNKVLSLDDITNNPFMSNFSDREEFKVNLWKHLAEDEKPSYLEKWRKQRENYEKEVEDLDEKYKTDFLEQMKGRDYFDEWEKRKEKYLDHFRER